jgi:hypothetical protein
MTQAEIKEVFAIFDKNRDGKISAKELATAMRLLKRTPTEAEIVVCLAQTRVPSALTSLANDSRCGQQSEWLRGVR